MKAHRIVQARLDMSRAVRRRAVKIAHLDRDRLYASLKVRTYRRGKHSELVLVRRLHADYRGDTEHIRSDIEGCA